MTLPNMKYASRISKKTLVSFSGYNHNPGVEDGKLWDMGNLCSDYYPLAAPRRERKLLTTLTKPNGICGGDKLAYVDDTEFWYNGVQRGTVTDSRKTFAILGDYICIFPDKKYFRTGALATYPTLTALSAAVTRPAYGDLYAVGPGYPYSLYYWNKTAWTFVMAEFGALESSYDASSVTFRNGTYQEEDADANTIYVAGVNWNDYFRVGDAVAISGCTTDPANNRTPIIREISEDGTELRFYENTFTLPEQYCYTVGEGGLPDKKNGTSINYYFKDKDSAAHNFSLTASLKDGDTITWNGSAASVTVVASGVSSSRTLATGVGDSRLSFSLKTVAYTEAGTVTIARKVPDMDFVIENENRLWGGKDDTIYASKLGSPFVWQDYDGLADGCWAADVGSAGEFTGAYSYLGYPVFFKEDKIYKVYGTKPGNYSLMASARLGVSRGNSASLAAAGEVLFYLSRSGMMAYTGGIPESIHYPLGDIRYREAVGGGYGHKYFVSMKDPEGNWQFFVFDTARNLWHREDNLHAVGFAAVDDLYVLDVDGKIWALEPLYAGGTVEGAFSWYLETGDMFDNSLNKKGMVKLQLRADLASGSTLTVKIQYDDGEWLTVKSITAETGLNNWYLPLTPRRSDHYRLRLEGRGKALIYQLARENYIGGER